MSDDFLSREASRYCWMPPIPQSYSNANDSTQSRQQVILDQQRSQSSYPVLLQNNFNCTLSNSGPNSSESKTLMHTPTASIPSFQYQQEFRLESVGFNNEETKRTSKGTRKEESPPHVKSSGENLNTYSLYPPMSIEEIKRVNEQNRRVQIELALKREGFNGQHTDASIFNDIRSGSSLLARGRSASTVSEYYDADGKRRTKRLKFKKQKGTLPLLVPLPNDAPLFPEGKNHGTKRENKGYEKNPEFDHLPPINKLHLHGQGPPTISTPVSRPLMAQQPSNPFASIRYPPTQQPEYPQQPIPFPASMQVQDQPIFETQLPHQRLVYMNYYYPPIFQPQVHPELQAASLTDGEKVSMMPNHYYAGSFPTEQMHGPVLPHLQFLPSQIDSQTQPNNDLDLQSKREVPDGKHAETSRVSRSTKGFEELQEQPLQGNRSYHTQLSSDNNEALGINLLASLRLNLSVDDLNAYLAALGISSLMKARELSYQERLQQLEEEERLKERQWSRIEQTLEEFCQPEKKMHIKGLCDQLFHVENPVKRKFNRVLLSKANNLADFVCGRVGNSTKAFKDLKRKFQDMEDYNTFPPNMLLQKFYESYKFTLGQGEVTDDVGASNGRSSGNKLIVDNDLRSSEIPEKYSPSHGHGNLLENVPFELVNASSTNINRRRKVLELNIQNLANYEFEHTNESKERRILLLQDQLKKLMEPVDIKRPLIGKTSTENEEFQTRLSDLSERRDYELIRSMNYNQYRISKLMSHYYDRTKDLYQEMVELANLRLFRLKHFLLCQRKLLERGKIDRDLLFDISSAKGVKLWDHFAKESSIVSATTPNSNSREVTPDATKSEPNEESQNNTDSDSTDASTNTSVVIKPGAKKGRKVRSKSVNHSFDEFSPILTDQEFFMLTNNNSKYYEKYVLRCNFRDKEVEDVERQVALKIADSLRDSKSNFTRQGRPSRNSTIEGGLPHNRNSNPSRAVRDNNAREALEVEFPRKTYPQFPEFTGEVRRKELSHTQSTIDLYFSQYRTSSGKHSEAQQMNRIFKHYRPPYGLDAEVISEDLRKMGINPIGK
ncbi:BA75_03454T0 [Komagataella pastoris]|uniref:BA75_03454T0 n=1 Tax=Komagataella pastoris TaxID=4922 RepID=A0A1B2JGT5_PICPA|nr:BA75_03454T0 [Komagataella pastoris]